MAPDTQSIDCNATFFTLGLALSHSFASSIDDPEYAGSEALSAAIKRVDLDDDDDDDDDEDEEEDDDLTRKMTLTRMTKRKTTRNTKTTTKKRMRKKTTTTI